MGYRVEELRKEKGMTQEELAKKSGISRQSISAIEKNRVKQVKSGTLIAIAEALGTTIDNLFFRAAV